MAVLVVVAVVAAAEAAVPVRASQRGDVVKDDPLEAPSGRDRGNGPAGRKAPGRDAAGRMSRGRSAAA